MHDNHFIILITVYNSVKWIKQCIDSAVMQKYPNRTIIVVDDHSTDGTWEIIATSNVDIKHRNPERIGDSMPNTVNALKLYSKSGEDIIVHLDGDDYLVGDDVLDTLNEVYKEDIWMTYGQYEPLSHTYHDYCKQITDTRTYRKEYWVTSHLKTWKRWLWDKIKNEDLRKPDGSYLDAATDCAFMFPMIEMAGLKHIKFIPRVLYMYNDLNPNNYKDARRDDSLYWADFIRNKEQYEEL